MPEFETNVQLSDLNISIVGASEIRNSWVHHVQPRLAQMAEVSASTTRADEMTQAITPYDASLHPMPAPAGRCRVAQAAGFSDVSFLARHIVASVGASLLVSLPTLFLTGSVITAIAAWFLGGAVALWGSVLLTLISGNLVGCSDLDRGGLCRTCSRK